MSGQDVNRFLSVLLFIELKGRRSALFPDSLAGYPVAARVDFPLLPGRRPGGSCLRFIYFTSEGILFCMRGYTQACPLPRNVSRFSAGHLWLPVTASQEDAFSLPSYSLLHPSLRVL